MLEDSVWGDNYHGKGNQPGYLIGLAEGLVCLPVGLARVVVRLKELEGLERFR